MSKRSGLSRLEDLKRWFIDVGRYRYILHKIDMEPWQNQNCPVCGEGFTSAPNFFMSSYPIHTEQCQNSKGEECYFTHAYYEWVQKTFYSDEEYA